MTELLLYGIAGIFIGIFSGFFGVGGGTVTVPFLIYMLLASGADYGIALPVAIGTSLLVAASGSLTASIRNRQHISSDFPSIFQLIAGSLPGTWIGVQIALMIPSDWLAFLLGGILAAVAIHYLIHPGTSYQQGGTLTAGYLFYPLFGLLIGIFSGLTGLGGGVLIIPALIHFRNTDARRAAMISSAVIIPTALAGLLQFGLKAAPDLPVPWVQWGFVSLNAGLPLMAGAIAGGFLGAHLLHGVPSPLWKRIFAVFLLLISADLFFVR